MNQEKPPTISDGDMELIRGFDSGYFYVTGLLTLVREEEISLQEAHQRAVEVPLCGEHIPHWNAARDFILANAEAFRIPVEDEEK